MPAVRVEEGVSGILVTDRSPRPGRFELRILYPNRPFAVRRALGSVMEGLADLGLDEDCASSVELVLAEVLNNVAEHAYPDDPSGLVELKITRRDGHLVIRVIDEGRPMPLDCLPAPGRPMPNRADGDLPEGGFGWMLIRSLAHGLSYERRDETNRLRFEMHFGRSIRGS